MLLQLAIFIPPSATFETKALKAISNFSTSLSLCVHVVEDRKIYYFELIMAPVENVHSFVFHFLVRLPSLLPSIESECVCDFLTKKKKEK
jgi:hypothetical protein